MRMETVQYYAELLGDLKTSEEFPAVYYESGETYMWVGQFPNGRLSHVYEMGAGVKSVRTVKRSED
jgi:hypothetical protein